jgi:hypothetical protein
MLLMNEQDLVYRLRKRAEIRRQIPGRKSVQEGAADRIADLLEEAATEIETLRKNIQAPREMTPEDFNGNQGRYEFYLEARKILQELEDQRQKNISASDNDTK